ncbi:helix-turn-helix domain-containing protein [Aquamicrobium segne]|uniref:Helix-turn-helix domain-containing protein n=1 Tax=Aquamicrobium segne TaxID=469547 RepID=A0ABW0GU02_9HYPH
MSKHHENYSENLRLACATCKSISELCRSIDINRQQFNRYINSGARPSAHNRHRIARFFGFEAEDFDLPVSVFRHRLETRHQPLPAQGPLADAFPGDLDALQPYLGFYQTWHVSLSWPGQIVCSCAHLRERDGQVVVTSLERIEDAQSGIRQRSRYVGLAAFQRRRIFLTELTRGAAPTFGQTILMPFEIHQRQYLRGLTMGISWRNDNLPYATRTIWRYQGRRTNRRALIAGCGIYEPHSASLPSPVVACLTEAEGVFLHV